MYILSECCFALQSIFNALKNMQQQLLLFARIASINILKPLQTTFHELLSYHFVSVSKVISNIYHQTSIIQYYFDIIMYPCMYRVSSEKKICKCCQTGRNWRILFLKIKKARLTEIWFWDEYTSSIQTLLIFNNSIPSLSIYVCNLICI